MDSLTDWLIQFVSEENNPAGLAVLGLSATVEYVFPPFPGDTITLFGAILITAYGWSFVAVFGTVLAGSVAGAMLAFWVGKRWQKTRDRRKSEADRSTLDRLVAKFERHGAAYLVLNRFVPGLRALFFVAAGLAGMKPWLVATYSTISAALWNLAIIALGSSLGANFETMLEWVQSYTLIAWVILSAIALLLLARWMIRRRRSQRDRSG